MDDDRLYIWQITNNLGVERFRAVELLHRLGAEIHREGPSIAQAWVSKRWFYRQLSLLAEVRAG